MTPRCRDLLFSGGPRACPPVCNHCASIRIGRAAPCIGWRETRQAENPRRHDCHRQTPIDQQNPGCRRIFRKLWRSFRPAANSKRLSRKSARPTKSSRARMISSRNSAASANTSRAARRRPITPPGFPKNSARTQIYLKREDLNHTGAHKLNHCMGEGLLARYMGKKKLIAETGAGMHGVALATAAAYFGLECDIYMGEVDIAKQAPNVSRMQILGARVIPGDAWFENPQGSRGRRALRLRRRSGQPDLLHRFGGRPASVPDDGPGFPTRRGHRGARAVSGNDGQPAGHRHRLRRRWQQCDGDVRRISR